MSASHSNGISIFTPTEKPITKSDSARTILAFLKKQNALYQQNHVSPTLASSQQDDEDLTDYIFSASPERNTCSEDETFSPGTSSPISLQYDNAEFSQQLSANPQELASSLQEHEVMEDYIQDAANLRIR